MPGDTAGETRRRYLDLIARCLGCVTDERVLDVGRSPTTGTEDWDVDLVRPLPAQGHPGGLLLSAHESLQLHRGPDALGRPLHWWVRITSYRHAVLDANGAELLSWSWFSDKWPAPRMYISGGPWADIGLPAGSVRLTGVLRLLLGTLRVPPLRPDWSVVLAESDAEFEMFTAHGRAVGPPPELHRVPQ